MNYLRVSIFGFPPASWALHRKEVFARRRMAKIRRDAIDRVYCSIKEASKERTYTHVSIPEDFYAEIAGKLIKKGYKIERWNEYTYSESLRHVKLSIQWG